MNQYERRFYEDIHKIVIIQEKILKELQKMNKPIIEDKEAPKKIEKLKDNLIRSTDRCIDTTFMYKIDEIIDEVNKLRGE